MAPLFLPLTLLVTLLLTRITSSAPLDVVEDVSKRADAVYANSISSCPAVAARSSPPTSVHDLRPDDFSYTMALGDSITASAFSRGIQNNTLLSFSEWRGESYAAGMDAGAITIPNLIKNYKPSLTGGSLGSNPTIELCFGPLCPIGPFGWNSRVDQLNAAQSGALATNLYHEVNDYLIPQVKARNIPASAYKYLNLQIGSNDICSMCFQSVLGFGPASPDDFEASIRKTLEAVRNGIPNTVVNVIGVFKVSDVYTMTLNQPYCSQLLPIPHANIECPCMLLGGSVGDTTRALMDKLMNQYNERLVKIVKEYQQKRYSNFAVLWQPPNIPLASYPVQALSSVDCFHPSTKTHRFIATQVWNRLVGTADERAATFTWSEALSFRCLQESDRIRTDTLL
ncbi:hypothetical protein PIIN_06162 [Serendipita indica DSM 11827]|uniref:Uncharacterized protein n=1 Tax=Serendipita indica (strain DSM 11827) TaxID=1109443 RepID=G4TLN5_SERID|nr:hypothetical protein PIIN_06162 [Serendipita indica DSM 11827]